MLRFYLLSETLSDKEKIVCSYVISFNFKKLMIHKFTVFTVYQQAQLKVPFDTCLDNKTFGNHWSRLWHEKKKLEQRMTESTTRTTYYKTFVIFTSNSITWRIGFSSMKALTAHVIPKWLRIKTLLLLQYFNSTFNLYSALTGLKVFYMYWPWPVANLTSVWLYYIHSVFRFCWLFAHFLLHICLTTS